MKEIQTVSLAFDQSLTVVLDFEILNQCVENSFIYFLNKTGEVYSQSIRYPIIMKKVKKLHSLKDF